MGDTFPKLKGAVVQAAPVFLNRDATVAKAYRFIEEAADLGAGAVAFPECFIAGYPHWYTFYHSRHQKNVQFYQELFKNAVVVPSPATDKIGEAARKARACVIMGVNEKEANSYGTLYNTLLFFGSDGRLLGKHRKLMPTMYERMVHTGGDGSTLEVFPTAYGGISGLICGENINSLARFALLAGGEVIHAAAWPAFALQTQGDSVRSLHILVKAHACEGKIFVLSSAGIFTEEMKDAMELDEASRKSIVTEGGHSGIVGPNGEYLAGPDVKGETVLCAELDLNKVVAGRYLQDVTGHYNRFDVFTLNVDRRTHRPIVEIADSAPEISCEKQGDVEQQTNPENAA